MLEIKIEDVTIDAVALTPALTVSLRIDYMGDVELPISITGKLVVGGKVCAYINEYSIPGERHFNLRFIATKEKDELFRQGNRHIQNYYAILTAPLSPKAIDHFESVRERVGDKSMHFQFDFVVKHLQSPFTPEDLKTMTAYSQLSFMELISKNYTQQFVIKQSDWVNKFSPGLGIGNFVLLEFQIPNKHEVAKEWKELYDRLYTRTQEMEQAIRQGDWQKTMFAARQFYENIKIGDKKPNHKWFADNLSQLFKNDQHSEEGFNNFLNGIYQFFDFTSKYIHDKDKQSNVVPIPVTTKEDAYFAYTLCVGLLNIVGKKISKI